MASMSRKSKSMNGGKRRKTHRRKAHKKRATRRHRKD